MGKVTNRWHLFLAVGHVSSQNLSMSPTLQHGLPETVPDSLPLGISPLATCFTETPVKQVPRAVLRVQCDGLVTCHTWRNWSPEIRALGGGDIEDTQRSTFHAWCTLRQQHGGRRDRESVFMWPPTGLGDKQNTVNSKSPVLFPGTAHGSEDRTMQHYSLPANHNLSDKLSGTAGENAGNRKDSARC